MTKKLFNLLTTVFLFGCLAWVATSCSDDDDKGGLGTGTVSGIITDDYDAPLEGVAVKLEGGTATATTNANGEFTLNEVAKDKAILTFTKQNYQTFSVTITPKSFSNGVALVNASMIYAAAKIYGTVLDGKHGNAPLAGVQVSISETQTVTTGADGTFTIDNLPLDAYTVTFTYDGYETVTRTLGIDGFIDGIATVDVTMGGRQILPHKTLDDLLNADHWFFSEYRGGRNGQDYPHFDWSTDFMATLDFQGAWEEQNEGTTLQIQNNPGDDQAHPADLNNFDSYVYGLKRITEDNKILTIQCRTHSASNDDPAVWGVQVVDMSQTSPSAVKLGENRTLNSEDYKSEVFDLSDYVGKEVIIAIGIYRARTGDYWKQFVLRRLAFNKTAIDEGFWGWLPGTAINDELSSWGLTQEMVRSAMPQTVYSFSGVSPMNGNPDFYCMMDGSFQNTKVFEGIYNVRVDGPFIPLVRESKDGVPLANETKDVKIKGKTEVIFNVKPFLRVEFVGYPTVSNGQITAKVKVTRGVSRDEFKSYIEPMGNYDESYPNVTDIQLFVSYSSSVGYRARDDRWSNSIEYSGDSFEPLLGTPVTIRSTKGQVIPSGRHVFVRAAARINYDTPMGSGTRRWNYSEPMEVMIP